MDTVADKADPPAAPRRADRDRDRDREARSTVAGRYEIDLDAPLGAGGLALVYPGRDLRTRRDVALKTLRLEYRHDPETRARFRREARLLAFLGHPNVVRVFDFVEDHGTSWVVLERVPGRSLKELLAERGPLPPEQVTPLLDQAAAALGHLHARGLVHLDVKPQNLLVTAEGRLKLIDFGLAQPAGGPQQTVAGRTFGTVAYLAPEQAGGEPVDAATDVYALGCVVYELLTGRPPFAPGAPGDPRNDLVRAHLERMPDPPAKLRPDLALPPWVDDVVLWALAKAPTARYRDAESFARVFRAGVEGEHVAGPGTTAAMALVDVPVRAPAPAPAAPTPRRAPSSRPGAQPAAGSGTAVRFEPTSPRSFYRPARRLWRAVAALGAADAMLALLLFLTQGGLPGVYEPAATALIAADGLRLRAEPGLAGAELGTLAAGERVAITGDPAPAADGPWWPVAVERDGGEVEGFVSAAGVEPDPRLTPWERLREGIGLD